jgi:hypothetical protein
MLVFGRSSVLASVSPFLYLLDMAIDSDRVVLHVFVSATTTLLNYLIADPRDPLAHSDLKLIEPLLELLGELSKTNDENQNTAEPMYRSCTELFERARAAVESAEVEEIFVDPKSFGFINGGGRRGKESVEDFIKRIESYAAGEEQIEDFH